MTINLELFYSTDPSDPRSPEFARPFSQGEFTFATNRHIAIRVPKVPGIRRRQKPDVATVFARHFNQRAKCRCLPFVAALESAPCPVCMNGDEDEVLQLCECEWCHSTGRVFTNVQIDQQIFDGGYIALIQNALGTVSVALARQVAGMQPMQFRFDGGEGLLMPLSRPLTGMPVIETV
jgi:hypothetical protein